MIVHGDCINLLDGIRRGAVNLAIADPPFNVDYKYDVYDDRRSSSEYLGWCKLWLGEIARVLADDGTFWLAIGPKFVSELDVISKAFGFHQRKHVIWAFTFGVNETNNFTTSHTHLIYYVKNPKRFTFNADAIRVPSARKLIYNDKRADPRGRLPDDTWILRPQDAPDAFAPDSDTWHVPRVNGTFKERVNWHPCQMPERVLARIIDACSNPGDLVLDPFAGSGTSLAVAKKRGRRWLGFELSEDYARKATERLAAISPGEPIAGEDEPFVVRPERPRKRKAKLDVSF